MTRKFQIGLGDVRQVPADAVQTSVQPTVSSIVGALGVDRVLVGTPSVLVVDQQVDPTTVQESQGSKTVFHSTLFESFDLRAVPTYNFYTADEETSVHADPSASLDELPRYVTLTWKPCPESPVLHVSQKGVRPTPRPPNPSVVEINVASVSAANGYIMPGVVNAVISEPNTIEEVPVLDEDAYLSSPSAAGQVAGSHMDLKSEFSLTKVLSPQRIRVSFIDPSIAGALDENRIQVAEDDVHLTAAASVAKVVGGLEVISEFNQDAPNKNPPPQFPAALDEPVLSYVGYIIERYDTLPDGTVRLGRTFKVDDIRTTQLIDREVLYGGRYAYRIRAISQWVHPPNVGFEGESETDRLAAVDEAIGTRVASYYFGDWSDWSRAEVTDDLPPEPPGEVYIRPVSRAGLIRIAWKMPNDPQGDIASIRLLRSIVREGSVHPWEQLGEFPAGNGAYDDHDVLPYTSGRARYIYSLCSVSVHGNISVLGTQVLVTLSAPSSRREWPLERVAPAGGDPTGHPTLGKTPGTGLVAHQRLVMYCRDAESVHPLRDRNYLVEVQSLSTGERAQVVLNVDTTEIPPRTLR